MCIRCNRTDVFCDKKEYNLLTWVDGTERERDDTIYETRYDRRRHKNPNNFACIKYLAIP